MSIYINWNPPIDQTGLTSYVIQINVNDTGWNDVATVDLNILSYTLPIAYGSNARFRIGAKFSSKPNPVFSPIYPSHPSGPAGKSPLPTYDMLTSTKTSFNYNVRYGLGSLSNSNFALFSNSAFGTKAGKYLGAGCGNVFFGNKSGRGIASDLFTSSRNTCIGNAIAVDGTADNIVIGNDWTIRGDNYVYIGTALTNETWLNGVVKNISSANDPKDMINKDYVDSLIKQNNLNNVVIIDGLGRKSKALLRAAVVPSGISVFGYNAMQGLTNNTIVGYNAAHDMSSTSTNVNFIGSNFDPGYASDTPAHVESSTFIGNNQRTGGASNTIQIANNTIRVDTASSNINLNSNALEINSTYRYLQLGTDNNNDNTNYMNGITAFDSCPTSILSAASDSDLINLTFAKSISVPKMLLFPGDFLTPSSSSEASVLLSKNNQIVYITSTHDESIDYFYINRNPTALLYPAQITTNYITGKRVIPYVTTTTAPITAFLSTMCHYNATPANSYVPIITNASFTDLSFNAPTLATTNLTTPVYPLPANSGASSAFNINTSSVSPLFLKYVSIPLIANSYTNFYFTIMTQSNPFTVLYQSAPTSFTLSADTMVEFELNNNDSNFISSANYPTVTAGNGYAIVLSAAALQFSTVLSNVSVFYCSANCSIGGSTSADLIPPFKMNKGDIVSIEWVNIRGGAPISYSNIYPTSVYSWYGYAQYKHFVKRPTFINTLYLNAPIVPNVATSSKRFINFHNDVNGFCKYNSTIMLIVKNNQLVCIDKSDGVVILSASDLDSMNITPVIRLIGKVHMDIEYKSTFLDPGAIAFDKTGANVSNRIVVSSIPPLNTSIVGTYTITYSITINADPSTYYYVSSTYSPFAQVTRTVTVVDIYPPIITLKGANPITIQANLSAAYVDAGATASDDYDGNISSNLTMVSTVNLAALGTYTVTYNVSDSNGNVASPAVRTVIVVDKTAPVITLNGANPLFIEWITDMVWTTPGTYTWIAPQGVTSVCAVAVGGGGGGGYQWNSGGGGGGGLGWKNNIAVVPGQSYSVVVGAGGTCSANAENNTSDGGTSYFINLSTVAGYGGGDGGPYSNNSTPGYGGGYVGDGGGRGGDAAYQGNWYYAGAGAGGYRGNGADSGQSSSGTAAPAGSGAGAAGGYYSTSYGTPGGGGVGIYGIGADGASRGQNFGGGGGSGGANGVGGEGSGESSSGNNGTITGGAFGGGGGGSGYYYGGGNGGSGAVRIIWGSLASFPSSAAQYTYTYSTHEPGATANDNLDGAIPSSNIVINSSAVNLAALGTYTVTYNVSDAHGNAATEVTRTVTVRDTTPPTITLNRTDLNPLYIEWSATPQAYVDHGATAYDNYDGPITPNNIIINSSAVNTAVLGTYTVTYNVSDSSGNAAATVTRTVIVRDTTPPTITLNGANSITVEAGNQYSYYSDPGATASDNHDGDITSRITVVSNVNLAALGTYTVTYNVSDSSGNPAAQVTRTVTVRDTTAPVIYLNYYSVYYYAALNSNFSPGTATAYDIYDGNIPFSKFSVSSNVNTAVIGTYLVTYNVSDSSGNAAAQVSYNVTVFDNSGGGGGGMGGGGMFGI